MYVEIKNLGDWHGLVNGRRVKEIYLVDTVDVLSIMDPVMYKNHFADGGLSEARQHLEGYTIPIGGVTLKVGAAVTKLDFAATRCTFDEPHEDTDNGLMYIPVIATEIPRNHPQLARWTLDNRYKKFIALWRDGNDMGYVSGSIEQGLTVSTQKVVQDENKVVFAITGQCPQPTWHLEGLDLEAHFGETDFGYEFSFDFNA